MYRVDANEIAWINQYRSMVKLVALAAGLLFASYSLVDWLIDPALLAVTWPWRLVGAAPCLAGVFILGNDRLLKWAPLHIAFSSVVVTTVVSFIFLGILHDINIAVAAQMQVLMAIAVFAAVRTAVRAVIPALLISFNMGLWSSDASWQMFALTNWLIFGAIVILLVVSETAYKTFVDKRQLEAEHQQRATIVQTSEDAIIGLTLDGRVISWNAGAKRLFGYSAEEMTGKTMQALLPPGHEAQEQSMRDRIVNGEHVGHIETVRICKHGVLKDVSISISPLHDVHGAITGFSKIARDISQRKEIERAMHSKDVLFRTAIETTSDGYWAVDNTGKLIDVNQAYVAQSGYSRAELLQMHIPDLEASEVPIDTAAHIEAIMRKGSETFETIHRRKDGSTWPVDVITTYSAINGGQFFVFTKDLTERKKAQAMTWHQANFDSLTDLPNRALLFDRLSKECSLARRNKSDVALLFADLDGFKLVNDSWGHEAGDLVLKEVARRWTACVREADTVARLGGDEFAIVLGGMPDTDAIGAMAQKLISALAAGITLPNGATCHVGASIGISIYPTHASESDALISRADAAMYQSKARGKMTFTFFAPS